MLPLAGLCLACTVASFVAPRWIGARLTEDRLRQRAESVALTVAYAADSMRHPEDLQRFVHALGSDPDVTAIVAVGGTPRRVVASTRNGWDGRPLDALPGPAFADDLALALADGHSHFGLHEDTREVDYTLAVPAGAGASLLADGAVMVHVDAAPALAELDDWSRRIGGGLLACSLLVIAGGALLVHRRLLAPLGALADAIAADRDATVATDDELGLLAETFNANRRAARETQRELRLALNEVAAFRDTLDRHSIISITDAHGRILDANPEFSRISGYGLEELLGRTHRLVNSGVHPPEFWREVWRTIAAGEPWRGEVCNRRKDGSLYWVDSIIAPFVGVDGRIERYVSIRTDVTARKLAELELVEARERAEAANHAKSEFLANMSHEIRTPMTAILGFADLLAHDLEREPEQAAEAVETIRSNARSLLTIINDILDVSKIEAGQLTVERIEFDPVTLLEEVVALARPLADQKGLSLEVRYTTPIPRRIRTDPTRLRQILVNLAGNAVKFTEAGGVRLDVACDPERRTLQVEVIDTGIGMGAEELAVVSRFRAFTQADTSTTRRFGGTGLGLRISNALAGLLGGELAIASTAGEGTRVRFTVDCGPLDGVPLAVPGPAPTHPSRTAARDAGPDPDGPDPDGPDPDGSDPAGTGVGPSSDAPPLADRHVLLAEDGRDNQRLIAFLLRKAGARVTLCDNGRIAVETLLAAPESERPDLVLMDMQMPELDGYGATRHLRESGFVRPIVALTAHAMAGDRRRCLDAGCDDYLSKPVDRAALVATCARLIDEGRSPRAIDRAS